MLIPIWLRSETNNVLGRPRCLRGQQAESNNVPTASQPATSKAGVSHSRQARSLLQAHARAPNSDAQQAPVLEFGGVQCVPSEFQPDAWVMLMPRFEGRPSWPPKKPVSAVMPKNRKADRWGVSCRARPRDMGFSLDCRNSISELRPHGWAWELNPGTTPWLPRPRLAFSGSASRLNSASGLWRLNGSEDSVHQFQSF